jgi:uncharacterized DUF497 family protein
VVIYEYMAKIEWDENKRLSNIAKHGFDFLDVEEVLYEIHGRFATVVFPMRGDDYRIITIRSARNDERGKYQELYS